MAIPAGIYPPVRLRFVPNQLVTENGVAEENSCSSGRFNCIITEDAAFTARARWWFATAQHHVR